jgi:hypothetical protein
VRQNIWNLKHTKAKTNENHPKEATPSNTRVHIKTGLITDNIRENRSTDRNFNEETPLNLLAFCALKSIMVDRYFGVRKAVDRIPEQKRDDDC